MQPAILADNLYFYSPSPLAVWVGSLSAIHDSIASILDLDFFIENHPFYFSLSSINDAFGSLIDDYFSGSFHLSWSEFNYFHEKFSFLLSCFEEIIFFPRTFPKCLKNYRLVFKNILSSFNELLVNVRYVN